MTRILATILLVMNAGEAVAEGLPVHSGEHENFSRLVFETPEEVDWRIGKVKGGYGIRFDRTTIDFDTSHVFELIPKDRIAAVLTRPNHGKVTIKTKCECHLRAFELDRGWLVVDVKTGTQPDSKFERPLEEQDNRRSLARVPLFGRGVAGIVSGSRHDGSAKTVEGLRRIGSRVEEDSAEPPRRSPGRGKEATGLNPLLFLTVKDDARSVHPNGHAQSKINVMLSDARKFLETVTEERNTAKSKKTKDRVTREIRKAREICASYRNFTIREWGSKRMAGEQLAKARRDLAAATGKTDGTGILELARLYLYLGFGEEAKLLLGHSQHAPEKTGYASVILEALGRPTRSINLATAMSCKGELALWAMLASDEVTLDGSKDRARFARVFKALPAQLQTRLKAEFDQKIGKPASEEADEVDPSRLTEKSMLKARSERGTEKGEEAWPEKAVRNRSSIGNGRLKPDVIEGIATAGTQGAAARTDTYIDVLDSFSFQLRGTERGLAYGEAALKASLRALDFESAAVKRKYLERRISNNRRRREINDVFYSGLTANGDDEAFLRFVLGDGRGPNGSSGSTKMEVAKRLSTLGLPSPAEELFSSVLGSGSPEERIGRAHAMVGLGRYAKALRVIAGLKDSAALKIRAQANAGLGRHAKAAAIYGRLGDESAEQAESWLSGDLRRIASDGTAEQRRLAELVRSGDLRDLPEQGGPLARSLKSFRQDMEHSQAVRAAARALLSATGSEDRAVQ